MIVDQAPAIPEVWDKTPVVEGTQVKGVIAPWNADWNLSFSSPS